MHQTLSIFCWWTLQRTCLESFLVTGLWLVEVDCPKQAALFLVTLRRLLGAESLRLGSNWGETWNIRRLEDYGQKWTIIFQCDWTYYQVSNGSLITLGHQIRWRQVQWSLTGQESISSAITTLNNPILITGKVQYASYDHNLHNHTTHSSLRLSNCNFSIFHMVPFRVVTS